MAGSVGDYKYFSPKIAYLQENEILIKDYSENEGMVEFLEKEGVIEDTGRRVHSGYVAVAICRLI